MFENIDIFYDPENQCYQMRTKSLTFSIEFDNDEKLKIFEALVEESKKETVTVLKIYNKLKKKFDEAKVLDVLSNLNDYDLLPTKDLFELKGKIKEKKNAYFNYDENNVKKLTDVSVLLFGNSMFSKKFIDKYSNGIFKKLEHISYSKLEGLDNESLKKMFGKYDFFVVDSTKWNPYYTELINKTALENNKPWLFVGGFEDYFLKVGPIFYGKETGCYNCLIKRIKSNNDYVNYLNSYESYLKARKQSSKPDDFIYLDVFYDIVANISLLEISKFFELWSVPVVWRHFITINAINYEMDRHALLKVPFCYVCKPELEYNPSAWLESITLK